MKICGERCEPETIIVVEDKENPRFGQIKHLHEVKDQEYLFVELLETHNYYAYEVQKMDCKSTSNCLVNVDNLSPT